MAFENKSRDSPQRRYNNQVFSSPLGFRNEFFDPINESTNQMDRLKTPLVRNHFRPFPPPICSPIIPKTPLPNTRTIHQLPLSPFVDLRHSPSLNISTHNEYFHNPPEIPPEAPQLWRIDQQSSRVITSIPNHSVFLQINSSTNLQVGVVPIRRDKPVNKVCFQLGKLNIFNTHFNNDKSKPEELLPKIRKIRRVFIQTNRRRPPRETHVNEKKNRVFCSCRKSDCVKEYCVCLKNNQQCNHRCRCTNCHNQKPCDFRNDLKRYGRRELLENKRVVVPVVDEELSKGCHCKKSHCLKNYCECFKRKTQCSDACYCEGCHNK